MNNKNHEHVQRKLYGWVPVTAVTFLPSGKLLFIGGVNDPNPNPIKTFQESTVGELASRPTLIVSVMDQHEIDSMQEIFNENPGIEWIPIVFDSDEEHIPEPEKEFPKYIAKCEEVARKIREHKDGNVFVHCWDGKSRSATLVTIYLRLFECDTLKDAMLHLQGQRPCVHPGETLSKYLVKWNETVLKRPIKCEN
jgi:protein-tyrosine phosphatase